MNAPKLLLKRGALVAIANWQVTLVQATADSLFKLLMATPLAGGVFLVALAAGTEPYELVGRDWRDLITTIVGSLVAHPLVLTAFLLALAVVGLGGSLFVFLVKAGCVATLVRGERRAEAVEQPPLHLEALRRASAFSPEAYASAAQRLFPRYARLGLLLIAIYVASAVAYLTTVFVLGLLNDRWGLAALASLGLTVWISLVNWGYLLTQIVIAADDCSVAAAFGRVARFLRHHRRPAAGVFLIMLALAAAATVVSWLATTGLWLIGFVPFIGLALIPLQILAWLMRSVVFQYLGLSSIGAYASLYRTLPTHVRHLVGDADVRVPARTGEA